MGSGCLRRACQHIDHQLSALAIGSVLSYETSRRGNRAAQQGRRLLGGLRAARTPDAWLEILGTGVPISENLAATPGWTTSITRGTYRPVVFAALAAAS